MKTYKSSVIAFQPIERAKKAHAHMPNYRYMNECIHNISWWIFFCTRKICSIRIVNSKRERKRNFSETIHRNFVVELHRFCPPLQHDLFQLNGDRHEIASNNSHQKKPLLLAIDEFIWQRHCSICMCVCAPALVLEEQKMDAKTK